MGSVSVILQPRLPLYVACIAVPAPMAVQAAAAQHGSLPERMRMWGGGTVRSMWLSAIASCRYACANRTAWAGRCSRLAECRRHRLPFAHMHAARPSCMSLPAGHETSAAPGGSPSTRSSTTWCGCSRRERTAGGWAPELLLLRPWLRAGSARNAASSQRLSRMVN